MLYWRFEGSATRLETSAEKLQKMASLQFKSDTWYCQFLYHGKRCTFTIGKVSEDEAVSKSNQVDYLLMRLKQSYLHLPPGMDIVAFLEFDGKPPEEVPDKDSVTLSGLRDSYLKTHRNGSLEESTLVGIELHFKHLIGTLGPGFPLKELQHGRPAAARRSPGKEKGDERKTFAGNDPQGDRHSPNCMELGRADGISYWGFSEQRNSVSKV